MKPHTSFLHTQADSPKGESPGDALCRHIEAIHELTQQQACECALEHRSELMMSLNRFASPRVSYLKLAANSMVDIWALSIGVDADGDSGEMVAALEARNGELMDLEALELDAGTAFVKLVDDMNLVDECDVSAA